MIVGTDIWCMQRTSTFRSFVPGMKECGIEYIRLEFNRDSIANLRNLVPLVIDNGFKVLGLLIRKDYAPDNVDAWGEWVFSVVNEFKQYVTLWECWNEPNLNKFFTGADPVKYTNFLKKCYTEAKRADPTCLVLGGAVAFTHNTALNFLRTMYQNGAKDYMDGVAWHPYCSPFHPEDTTSTPNPYFYVPRVKDVMEQYGDPNKIWITELGWDSHNGITEDQQAEYIVRALELAYQWGWVELYIIYKWRDSPNIPKGLLRSDGTRKPSYDAVKDFIWNYIPPTPTPPIIPIAASVGLGTPIGSFAGYAITKKPAGALVGGILGGIGGAIAGAIIRSRGSRGKHSPPSYEPCPECGNYSLLETSGIVECPACGARFRAVWEGVK